MSILNELIQDLCPNGVLYKYLGDVCDYVRGITYNKAQEAKESNKDTWKVLRANNITLSTKTLNFDDIKEVVSTVKVKDSQHLQRGDILICAGSGSKEHIGKVAYISENLEYTFGGFMAVIRCHQELNSRFLFHILTGNLFSSYLETALNTTTINNLNASIMSNFCIPLPPLPVQQEIVRILDNFTELTAELTAELAARRKQYEHYRDELLRIGVPIKLSDIAYYSRGRIAASTLTESTYVGVDNLLPNKLGKRNSECVPTDGNVTEFKQGDILIGNIRPYLKKIWKATTNGGTNGDVLPIRVIDNNVVSANYLYYVLSSDYFFTYDSNNAKGAKMPRGDKEAIMNYQFQLPSILEQQRIVTILDRFDTLCNDLTSGLPAEITARQKQYEYYRDKLLTFKEKV